MRLLLLAAVVLIGLALVLTAACGEEEAGAPGTATPSTGPEASPTASAKPTPTTAGTPNAWKTLTNTAFGYSIQYPADWLVNPGNPFKPDPATSDYVALYNFQPPETGSGEPPSPGTGRDKLKIELYVLDNPKRLDLEQWVKQFHDNADTPTTVLSSSSTQTNGLSVIRQVITFGGPWQSLEAFADLGSAVLLVNGPQADSLFLDSYDNMLASLRALP